MTNSRLALYLGTNLLNLKFQFENKNLSAISKINDTCQKHTQTTI